MPAVSCGRNADGLAQTPVSGGPSFCPGPLFSCSHSATLEKQAFQETHRQAPRSKVATFLTRRTRKECARAPSLLC